LISPPINTSLVKPPREKPKKPTRSRSIFAALGQAPSMKSTSRLMWAGTPVGNMFDAVKEFNARPLTPWPKKRSDFASPPRHSP